MGAAQSTDEVMRSSTLAATMRSIARSKGNAGLHVKVAGDADVTYEQAQAFEFANWYDVPGKDWEAFKRNRPYSIKGHECRAPSIGAKAPNGAVLSLDEGRAPSTLHKAIDAAAKDSGVVALIFGSLSCPVWRGWAALDLHNDVTAAGIPALHVYQKEAHAAGEFEHKNNLEGPIALRTPQPPHANEAARRTAAKRAKAHLEAQLWWEQPPFSSRPRITMVLDGMDDKLEAAYESRPFRLYLVEAASKKVVHSSSLAPFNMDAKRAELKACLEQLKRV